MGKADRKNISGVLLLDKGTGQSSNKALQRIKWLFRAKKTGHTGTLDPLASGLLPLMFGQATKFAADLIEADKQYEATVRLGFSSSTGDAEGEISQAPFDASPLTMGDLVKAAQGLTGEIEQVPPMYSALKKDGRPLYEYARQGQEVERTARRIQIKSFEILELIHQPKDTSVRIKVLCSKGTYVRTLAEDFAKALGTQGYLTALRRTGIGKLEVDQALTVEKIEDLLEQGQGPEALLAPVDSLLSSLQSVKLDEEQTRRFMHGQRLPLSLMDSLSAKSNGRSRIYGVLEHEQNAFLGTGILETDGKTALLRPERLIQETL